MTAWTFLIYFFEFSAFITSAFYYKNLKNANLKSLPFFLFFVFLGEIVALLLAKKFHTNLFYYNIFTALQMIYYLVLIGKHLNSNKAKIIILSTVLAFIVFTSINFIFVQDLNIRLDSYSFTFGCFLITIWVTYYFFELLNSDQVEDYGTQPMFWIGIGLFIFYLCNIPYMSIFNYLQSNYKTIFNAYFKIIQILGYFMYTFFIIGILCLSKRR